MNSDIKNTPQKLPVEYLGEAKVRFTWPCGHYRTEDYMKKKESKKMWPEGVRMMVRYWQRSGIHLGKCPTCGKLSV